MGTFDSFEGPAIVQNNPFDFLKLHISNIRIMRINIKGFLKVFFWKKICPGKYYPGGKSQGISPLFWKISLDIDLDKLRKR
jgi:hypothetical protein